MTVPIKIYSIDEQPAYQIKQQGLVRSDIQEWFVDLGGKFSRDVAVPFLLSQKSLPSPFQQNPNNALQFVEWVNHAQHRDLPNVWIITVEWKTITNIQQTIADPTKRPALIDTGTYTESESPDVDWDGLPNATTAGEPLDFTYNRRYPTFLVEKKLYPYPQQFGLYRDFVNSDTVVIYGNTFPPYTLSCPEVHISSLQWEGRFPFYDLSCTWYVNFKKNSKGEILGWRQIKRNAGYHEKKFIGYARLEDVIKGKKIQNSPRGKYNTTVGWTVFKRDLKNLSNKTYYIPQYAFQAIQLGSPGRYSYPSSPVLLDPNGRAYREVLETDKFVYSDNGVPLRKKAPKEIVATGPVIGSNNPDDVVTTSGITPEQWEAAVVERRHYNFVSFNDLFSFAINDPQDIPGGNIGAASK